MVLSPLLKLDIPLNAERLDEVWFWFDDRERLRDNSGKSISEFWFIFRSAIVDAGRNWIGWTGRVDAFLTWLPSPRLRFSDGSSICGGIKLKPTAAGVPPVLEISGGGSGRSRTGRVLFTLGIAATYDKKKKSLIVKSKLDSIPKMKCLGLWGKRYFGVCPQEQEQ